MNEQKKKFGMADRVGYALGDMGGSFVNLYIDAFILLFATDVLKIAPTFMSGLFLFARLFDAINDPLIGSFPDRWRLGKSGNKFKPWIKIFMIPLAVSVLLVFYNVGGFSISARHVWISFAYIFYGVSYTGTSMPYGSMASVISQDPDERTQLSSARAIGGMLVGYGFLTFVPKFIFDSDKKIVPSGFFTLAIVFALLSLASYVGLLKLTTERVHQPHSQTTFNYGDVLKGVGKNRPLIGIMIATIGSLIYITANSQLAPYIMKDFYKRPDLLTIRSLMAIPLSLFAIFFGPVLAKKFGKRNLILAATAFNLILSAGIMFFHIPNVWVYMVLYTLANIGQAFFAVLVWALVTDCLDYHEYLMHQRSDGSLYSIFTFARKLGATAASTLGALVLGMIGYDQTVESGMQTLAVDQKIYTMVTATPVIASILVLLGLGLIFNITKHKQDEITAELIRRREAGE